MVETHWVLTKVPWPFGYFCVVKYIPFSNAHSLTLYMMELSNEVVTVLNQSRSRWWMMLWTPNFQVDYLVHTIAVLCRLHTSSLRCFICCYFWCLRTSENNFSDKIEYSVVCCEYRVSSICVPYVVFIFVTVEPIFIPPVDNRPCAWCIRHYC